MRIFPAIFLNVGLFLLSGFVAQADPVATAADVTIRRVATAPRSVQLELDPSTGNLLVLQQRGQLFRLDLSAAQPVFQWAGNRDPGLRNITGLAIGKSGAIYLVGSLSGRDTVTGIVKTSQDGGQTWQLVCQSEPYARSNTAYDHRFGSILLSPDEKYLYIGSGSRTDHGEIQTNNGLFPGLREEALTAVLFRLPSDARNVVLKNDLNTLRQDGYIYAEGLRNPFTLAFDGEGRLFAGDNGPDRDMPDELNWIQEGKHYGFPWRMGGLSNPQQNPNYDPSADKLLNPHFHAVARGYYANDPTFPHPPPGFQPVEPVANKGPDGGSYRLETGAMTSVKESGQSIATFTPHRCPTGLCFDTEGKLPGRFNKAGFILGWTRGDPDGDAITGPFEDAGEDLLLLKLSRKEDNFEAEITQLAKGFGGPVDSVIVGEHLYVLELDGSSGIYEITFAPQGPAQK